VHHFTLDQSGLIHRARIHYCRRPEHFRSLRLEMAAALFAAGRQARSTTMHAREMIGTHPAVQGQINDALIRCIEECYSCAQTCTSCADACLSERMVQELTQCIRLDLDCADICNITGRILTRRTGSDDEVMRRMLSVCAAACRLCAEECQKHASMHEHCRICAESCRRCMEACQELSRGMAH
jgi:hypothetical protein